MDFTDFDEFSSSEWVGREAEWFRHSHNLNVTLSYLDSQSLSRVLDISAGSGYYTVELAVTGPRLNGPGWTVYAGVASPEQLEQVRDRAAQRNATSRVETVSMLDPRTLTRFEDDSFDVVLALGPFYEFQDASDREHVAREITRVLKPEGYLLAVTCPRLLVHSL